MRSILRAIVGTGVCALFLLLQPASRTANAQRAPDPFQPTEPTGPGLRGGGGRQGVIANVNLLDAPVTTVFRMVSDATGWTILLSPEVSKSPPKINLWIKDLPPEQVLDRVSTLAGLVVVHAGYSAAFLALGGIAAIGAVVCLLALPETRQSDRQARGKTARIASATAAE